MSRSATYLNGDLISEIRDLQRRVYSLEHAAVGPNQSLTLSDPAWSKSTTSDTPEVALSSYIKKLNNRASQGKVSLDAGSSTGSIQLKLIGSSTTYESAVHSFTGAVTLHWDWLHGAPLGDAFTFEILIACTSGAGPVAMSFPTQCQLGAQTPGSTSAGF